MNNLNIFYFDNDLGKFDEFNPRFVMEQNYTKQIITIISTKTPFYYNTELLAKKINTNVKDLQFALQLLKNISAIQDKNGYFCLNFPFFLDKDIKIIQSIVSNILNKSKEILTLNIQLIKQKVSKIYPNIRSELSLYHLLCGKIFDGIMFEFLEQQGLLKQSYIQNDNRDYMLIGYQNSHKCNKFNANLYCSFNNAKYNNNSLTSFGNANGDRLDYFRYFKLREKNTIYGKFSVLHKNFANLSSLDIIKISFNVIVNLINNIPIEDNKYLKMLKYTNYIDKNNKIIVPIFDDYINKTTLLFNEVKEKLGCYFTNILNSFKEDILKSNITCVKHNIPIDQLCNELWHIFFGLLNQFLIKEKIVASPQHFFRQGKYLKCIYLIDNK